MDLLDPVFMMRSADFGANFNSKPVIALLAIGLLVWDRYRYRRWDYLWVFLTGTIIWTLVELAAQTKGTRLMPVHELFGAELPLAASTLLQGMTEGAAVAVFGLFIGDRILMRGATRNKTVVAFALAMAIVVLLMVVQSASSGAQAVLEAASQRDMTERSSLLLFLAATIFAIWFWIARPQFRVRSLTMTAVMIAFAAIWTVTSVATGGRWVEVSGTAPGSTEMAPGIISVLALAYDVLIEIAIMYMPFFAIPALIGLISVATTASPDPPESRQAAGR
jgi:hypothetical protein